MATRIAIRAFQSADAGAFRSLNEEWITRYFKIEPKDEETLRQPQAKILDRGGSILMAFRDDEAVGCVALLAIGEGEFEVAKMAVTEAARGTGAGRLLLEAAIANAHAAGATRLYLETNHILTPAITLYKSVGFRELPGGHDTPYARADVFMELFL